MFKTVIVVAVLAFALQCVLAGPVSEDDVITSSTEAAVTDLPSTHGDDVSTTTSSSPNVTSTVDPGPSNGAFSAGSCVLFAQVFAMALVTRLLAL